MSVFNRVFLIVLDGVGVGALPDAADYGDDHAATLPHVAAAVDGLDLPNLQAMGLGNICGIKGVRPQSQPHAAWGKLAQRSAGKDSVTGHWELAGLIRQVPFSTFPEGFPSGIIQQFTDLAGQEPLGNIAVSGTDILQKLGLQHLETGRPIVYTSSDSVFQVAAHEDLLPPAQLYRLCARTLEILRPYNICRVIARPFVGDCPENFRRTSGRHDFPVVPGGETLLDRLQRAGIPTCGIGKIGDLFAGRGLSRSLPTHNNAEGCRLMLQALEQQQRGLVFVNLVDFDMLYGHRRDCRGFADALHEFDTFLPRLMTGMTSRDLLIITADHGCDPTTAGTDHAREYIPLLAWTAQNQTGISLGVRDSFADIAATVAEIFAIEQDCGKSFLSVLPACGSAA